MSTSIADRTTVSGQRTARFGIWVLPVSLYLVGFVVFFRWQIFSNFDLIFGDRGDARMVAFLHEHVYRWFFSRVDFLSPAFFYDQTKTLGYTDAFLLDQVIYAPLRLVGAEPLLALSLVAVILSPFAFLFLYLLLRRLDVSVPLASLAAFIFTFANNLFLNSGHLQHFTVYYLPIVAYCGLFAVGEIHRRPMPAHLLGNFAAAFYGFVFSTGYYMAWFFGLALIIFTPVAAYVAWPGVQAWWHKGSTRVLRLGLFAGLSFLAALSLSAVIYLPVLAGGAARSFGEYLVYAPTPIDAFNVGSQNLVWSGLIRSLHLIRDERLVGEWTIALTPGIQFLVLVSAIIALQPRLWPSDDTVRRSRAIVIAGASVCLLFYILTIRVHNFSLFHLLYTIMPGAKAIRAGYRGMLVANLFAVAAIAIASERMFRLSLQMPRKSLQMTRIAALAALLLLATIEQVNLAQAALLSRAFEREHMAAVDSPPHQCRSFYAAPQVDRAPFEVQADAIMIAMAHQLPTINGYSGFDPPGWDFYDTNAADYEQRALRWAVNRGIAEGLCRVDVDAGAWTVVTVSR